MLPSSCRFYHLYCPNRALSVLVATIRNMYSRLCYTLKDSRSLEAPELASTGLSNPFSLVAFNQGYMFLKANSIGHWPAFRSYCGPRPGLSSSRELSVLNVVLLLALSAPSQFYVENKNKRFLGNFIATVL